jgi:hypothetical protein
MPARAAIGSVPLVAVVVSMLVTVATTVVINRLAGRIYAGALLRFGPRVRIREAFRAHDRRRNGDSLPPPPPTLEPLTTRSRGLS